MSNEEFMQQIKRRVPCRLRTYRENGKLMVGYGHNLTDYPVTGIESGDKIGYWLADQLLAQDVARMGQKVFLDMLLPEVASGETEVQDQAS